MTTKKAQILWGDMCILNTIASYHIDGIIETINFVFFIISFILFFYYSFKK